MSGSKLKHKILPTEVHKLEFPIATMSMHVLGVMPPGFKFKNIFYVCAGIHNNSSILITFLKMGPWVLSVRNRTRVQET